MRLKQNFFIVLIVALVVGASAPQVEAAVARHAVKVAQRVKNFVGKTADDAAGVLWRNKGAVAVGATAVAVATKPEVFVGGATKIATSPYGSTILFYLIATLLIIVGVRYLLHRVGLWRVLPLVVLGLLLCGGVAQAGVVDFVPAQDAWFSAIHIPLQKVWIAILVIVSLFI